MVDLDHFKHINDTFGHAAGDMVLSDVANTIIQCVRPTDFCFRYGGEEIMLILTHMNETTTLQKAEHIRKSIAETNFTDKVGRPIVVTTSIGAALHHGHPDYQKTIDEADQNLYKAKEAGRNTVVI